jgi:hypothetical protein
MGLLTLIVNIGSPNGQAIRYFLAQHKRQIGGKYVSKINIFRGDAQFSLALCLLFTIENRAGAANGVMGKIADDTGRVDEAIVVKRGNYGRSVMREHVVWTKL